MCRYGFSSTVLQLEVFSIILFASSSVNLTVLFRQNLYDCSFPIHNEALKTHLKEEFQVFHLQHKEPSPVLVLYPYRHKYSTLYRSRSMVKGWGYPPLVVLTQGTVS